MFDNVILPGWPDLFSNDGIHIVLVALLLCIWSAMIWIVITLRFVSDSFPISGSHKANGLFIAFSIVFLCSDPDIWQLLKGEIKPLY